MVRLLGASALALTMMTATADAAHRRHHTAHAGYRHDHRVRHASAFRSDAYGRRQDALGYASHHPGIDRPDAADRHYAYRNAYRRGGFGRTAFNQPRLGGRPSAWCGWYARSLVGSDPGPAFNLARNWAHWGRASGPGVGVMVVWPHHVGMITGRTSNGQWIVRSGNDGHAVRERPRSIAGAIAFRAS